MKTTMFLPIFMLLSVFSASASNNNRSTRSYLSKPSLMTLGLGVGVAGAAYLALKSTDALSTAGRAVATRAGSLPTLPSALVTEFKNNAVNASVALATGAVSATVLAKKHLPAVQNAILEQATKKNAANFVTLARAATLANGVRTGSWKQITGGAAALTLALNHSSFAPSNQDQNAEEQAS